MLGRWADSLSKPRKKHSLENFKYAWTKRERRRAREREREKEDERERARNERERGRLRTRDEGLLMETHIDGDVADASPIHPRRRSSRRRRGRIQGRKPRGSERERKPSDLWLVDNIGRAVPAKQRGEGRQMTLAEL